MKKLTHVLGIVITVFVMTLMGTSQVSAQEHSVGMVLGVGPHFNQGGGAVLTYTGNYKYLLSEGRMGVGGNLGLFYRGISAGGFAVGSTSFLIAGSFDYYFMTDNIKPYASIDLGGVFGAGNAMYISPGGGVKFNFPFLDRLDFDGGLRFPITTDFQGAGAGLTFNFGAHYRF